MEKPILLHYPKNEGSPRQNSTGLSSRFFRLFFFFLIGQLPFENSKTCKGTEDDI